MKSIGLIGGISWHATAKYYSYINQAVNDHFGNNTNPPIIIFNLNQSKMHELQKRNDWASISKMVYEGALSLQKAGADTILICSNTTHKVFPSVQNRINFPILHIADATANYIKNKGLNEVGFIGTKYTMEHKFLIDRIKAFDINVFVPERKSSILELHRIIHDELTYNKFTTKAGDFVLNEIHEMKLAGAQGIILGCTEFSFMFDKLNLDIPVFDTIEIHAQSAVDFILMQTAVEMI
jgi:aspartate racemase